MVIKNKNTKKEQQFVVKRMEKAKSNNKRDFKLTWSTQPHIGDPGTFPT